MSWIDVLGYAASAMVLATFCMTTMQRLRLLAIGSNILFIGFGTLAHIYPVLILHLTLLPVNVARLAEVRRRTDSHHFVGRLLWLVRLVKLTLKVGGIGRIPNLKKTGKSRVAAELRARANIPRPI